MALNRNSTTYVTGFVVVITVVCAFIIATAATLLKPTQQQQIAANVQGNVLKVSGVAYTPANLFEQFQQRVEVRYLDRKTGTFTELPAGLKYDEILTSNKYADYRSKITTAENLPGLKDNLIPDILQVYLIKDEANKVVKVILPFHGNGLWSVMYGLLAVNVDGNTVEGITYYSQGETPGLGGEVENPLWTSQFIGKSIYEGDSTNPQLELTKNASAEDKYKVNALTGATLTSVGVNNQLHFWLGELGYAKFLTNLRQGAVNLNE